MKLGSIVVALLLVLVSSKAALAHAQLDRADPPADTPLDQSPPRVQVWFTEPIEPNFSEIQVLDANGQRVDKGDSALAPGNPQSMTVSLPPLEKGVYTVAWKNLSTVDGHVVRGTYSLLIGVDASAAPPPAVEAPDTAGIAPLDAPIRWLGYLGAATLVGALLLLQLVLLPAARSLRLASTVTTQTALPLRRLLWAAWAALLVGSLAGLLLQAANASGGGLAGGLAALGPLLTATRAGALGLVRLGLLLALAVGLWLFPRQRRLLGVLVLLTSGVMATSSLNSHSGALGAQAAQAMAIDWLHFMGVSVWVGGLVGLAALLPRLLAALPVGQRWPFLARLIRRFSGLAVASVAVLGVTGAYLAWQHVGSLDALTQTLYGRSLAAKLALFGGLLLLGAFNLLVVSPRLDKLTATRGEALPTAAVAALGRRFSRAVRLETLLAALALLAAGAMASLTPARPMYERLLATRPLEMTTALPDLRLTLTVSPARPGVNTFTVTLRDGRGRPIDDAERVDLRFTYLGEDLGTIVQVAQPQGNGQYTVRGGWVGVEGRWQTEMLVRRPGQDDLRTAFRYSVSRLAARQEVAAQGAPSVLPMLVAGGVLAALLLGALAVYVARTIGLRSPAGAATGLLTLACLALAVLLTVQGPSGSALASGDTRTLRNPFPPTPDSIARGRETYQTECVACHGVRGRGDGPAAVSLNPKPADFRVHMAAGHTDADLFYWLSEGVAGTAMPAFKDRLSADERWHVINYLKTFAPVTQ